MESQVNETMEKNMNYEPALLHSLR
jgi:hypothetical protein